MQKEVGLLRGYARNEAVFRSSFSTKTRMIYIANDEDIDVFIHIVYIAFILVYFSTTAGLRNLHCILTIFEAVSYHIID